MSSIFVSVSVTGAAQGDELNDAADDDGPTAMLIPC